MLRRFVVSLAPAVLMATGCTGVGGACCPPSGGYASSGYGYSQPAYAQGTYYGGASTSGGATVYGGTTTYGGATPPAGAAYGGSANGSSYGPSGQPAGVPPPPPPESASRNTVEIRDSAFTPESITVHQGETVRWINLDAKAHTVTRRAEPAFDFQIAPNEERSFTFHSTSDANGFEYECSIHPKMRHGRVVVLPPQTNP